MDSPLNLLLHIHYSCMCVLVVIVVYGDIRLVTAVSMVTVVEVGF